MDAKAVADELRAAKAEHAEALEKAERAREALEAARADAAAASSAQRRSEQQIERAAARLAAEVGALQVAEARGAVERFLVELHANVGSYSCFLVLGPEARPVLAEELSVQVAFPTVELVRRIPGSDVPPVTLWRTTIDCDVQADQCSVAKKEDHLYLRLPLKESEKQSLGGLSSFSRVAPEELETLSYASLWCRSCDTSLLDKQHSDAFPSDRFDKVLPLPSTNWMEMFDFWGSGIGAFEHIPRDGIASQKRRIFVGEADIMMHREDLSESAIVCEPVAIEPKPKDPNEKSDEQWETVFCGKCRSIIGLSSTEIPTTLRLHKHVIGASSKSTVISDHDIFERYTIDSILSAKLLELADSDGIFRYRLTPLKDAASFVAPPPVIGPIPPPPQAYQLQLLSWETMVQDEHSPTFRRVLKVLFAPADNDASSTCAADHHKQHHHPPLPMHQVALSPETLRIIIKRLEKSSKVLPPSLQMFTDKRVGYLYA